MQNNSTNDEMIDQLISMSETDFQALGADGLAYIRPLGSVNNIETFAVHAADGSHIATGPDEKALRAIAGQSNLVSVMLQ